VHKMSCRGEVCALLEAMTKTRLTYMYLKYFVISGKQLHQGLPTTKKHGVHSKNSTLLFFSSYYFQNSVFN
jgi:hypothetical protein